MSANFSAEKRFAIKAAEDALGPNGRMISSSKSGYRQLHPKNITVFNANICTRTHGKIWHGDIDVTVNEEKLKKLSSTLDEPVLVLSELDGRFENEAEPLLENALVIVTADTLELCERQY